MSAVSQGRMFRARHVLPVVRPAIEDGAVAVEGGRIVAVGPHREVAGECPGFAVEDLGDAVLLPGLVNAHVHLDNSALAGKVPRGGGDFIGWIGRLLTIKDTIDVETKRDATEAAVRSLPGLGTAALGDVCPTLLSPPFLGLQPLRARVFIEVTGIGPERGSEKLAEAADNLRLAEGSHDGSRLQFSLSPHAPYSTDASVIAGIIAANAASQRISTFHLAESSEEVDFLTGKGERFEQAIRRWGYWCQGWRPPGVRPVAYFKCLGGLRPGTIAVHCVQLDDEDIALLAESGCSVCLCPRSNAYIGVGRPRIEDMLAAGIEPCLGTDGLGSVQSLSIFDEMAFVRSEYPGVEPSAVLRMATLNGALALGFADELGALSPGRLARFLVYSGPVEGDPEEALTSGIDHAKLCWAGGGDV